MSEPKIGAGDIEIDLDGQPHVLRPSLAACQAISRMGGGLAGAVERCNRFDFDTICDIIGHGLSANPAQRQKMIPDLVYKTGTFQLAAACIDFIRVVGHGGQMPPDEPEGGDDRRPLDEPSPSESSTILS
jgi:hypothetical protein